MSGGHFDYQQYRISEIADEIRRLIETNDTTEVDSWGDRIGKNYPPEVITRFREAEALLRKAAIYVQRIDWLVCDDDGPQSFLKHLDEQLDELQNTRNPIIAW